MQRRNFLKALFVTPLLGFWRTAKASSAEASSKDFSQIAFGSCCDQNLPQPIWNVIRRQKPDAFAFIGDNIYGDTEDMQVMQDKYRLLGKNIDLIKLRNEIPIIATWDDHDFGANDAGREYPQKQKSKDLMLNFFREPANSPRRKRDGVYTSYFTGPYQQLQIILLDLRWFRSPLVGDDKGYHPNPDPSATMLGSEQWAWLEEQLRKPAEFRILFSSTQLVPSEHSCEKWANFPLEKARLFELIDRLQIKNLVVASGDMHYGELSKEKTPAGFEIYDLTASGLNFFEPSTDYPNSKRIAVYDADCNYGWISIDWRQRPYQVRLELRNSSGDTVILQELSF